MSGLGDSERDLRDALRSRAAAVPVGRADHAGLGRRLSAARRRRRAKLGGAALTLVVLLGALSVGSRSDGSGPNVTAGPDPSSTTTIPEPSTTTPVETIPGDTTPTLPPVTVGPPGSQPGPSVTSGPAPTTVPRTTSTTAPLPPVPDDALWPPPGSRTTFATPEAAAEDFARRFLGMGTPQVTPGRVTVRGDEALADLRPLPSSSLTTVVLLRRVGARGWVVLSCSADNIQLDQPTGPNVRVTSPLTVRGRVQAFEGHVDIEVRRDGTTTPIGRSFGTGASDSMAPFESTVTFSAPPAGRGALVLSDPRADDPAQGPLSATVIRISF